MEPTLDCTLSDLTPYERFQCLMQGVGGYELSWTIFGIVASAFVYYLATVQFRNNKNGPNVVIGWLTSMGIIFFLLHQFGWGKIVGKDENLGLLSFVLAAIASIVVVILLLRKSDDEKWANNYKVINGSIVITVCVAMLVSFGKGVTSMTFGLLFGFTSGVSLGMFIVSLMRMNKSKVMPGKDKEAEDWRKRDPKIGDDK